MLLETKMIGWGIMGVSVLVCWIASTANTARAAHKSDIDLLEELADDVEQAVDHFYHRAGRYDDCPKLRSAAKSLEKASDRFERAAERSESPWQVRHEFGHLESALFHVRRLLNRSDILQYDHKLMDAWIEVDKANERLADRLAQMLTRRNRYRYTPFSGIHLNKCIHTNSDIYADPRDHRVSVKSPLAPWQVFLGPASR